jgi:hypothetical protein
MTSEDNPRYLRFSQILLDREPIRAYCSRCERKFADVYRADERTDNVLPRIRVEFEEHQCAATTRNPAVN